MKISISVKGGEQVGRRLGALGKLPGLDQALWEVAEAVRAEATANLRAWPGAAGTPVRRTGDKRFSQQIGAGGNAAWGAEFGQRGRAANQWLSRAFAARLDFARAALRRAVRVALANRRIGR